MTEVRGYILCVTAAAVLAAILRALAGQGTMGTLVRLLGGLFMALTVLSPLMDLELPDPERWMSEFRFDGMSAASEGAEMAEQAEQAIIKPRLEAYILDKAALYGADLAVDVELDASGLPVSVTVEGSVQPSVRRRLTSLMETELGLDEGVQHWIG